MEQSEVIELLNKKVKLEKKIKKMHEEISSLNSLIKDNCNHPVLVEKSSWSYGGYDYQGVDRNWNACEICGHTQDLQIRDTGFG